jgi:hypothetical protein
LATVLAALKVYHGMGAGSLLPWQSPLTTIATDGGRHIAMTAAEVAALADRLALIARADRAAA